MHLSPITDPNSVVYGTEIWEWSDDSPMADFILQLAKYQCKFYFYAMFVTARRDAILRLPSESLIDRLEGLGIARTVISNFAIHLIRFDERHCREKKFPDKLNVWLSTKK